MSLLSSTMNRSLTIYSDDLKRLDNIKAIAELISRQPRIGLRQFKLLEEVERWHAELAAAFNHRRAYRRYVRIVRQSPMGQFFAHLRYSLLFFNHEARDLVVIGTIHREDLPDIVVAIDATGSVWLKSDDYEPFYLLKSVISSLDETVTQAVRCYVAMFIRRYNYPALSASTSRVQRGAMAVGGLMVIGGVSLWRWMR